MTQPFNRDMIRYDAEPSLGVVIEYAPEEIDVLRNKQLSDENVDAIIHAMTHMGKEALVQLPSLGLEFCYDWTTGIDFGRPDEGGGYVYTFTHDSFYGPAVCKLIVEWHDAYIEDIGLAEERADEGTSFVAGVPFLNEFLGNL